MALKHHTVLDERFRQQKENAENYFIPFLEQGMVIGPDMRVMEIGCDVGGVLEPFVAKGGQVLGVDLNSDAIAEAVKFHAEAINRGEAEFVVENILEEAFLEKWAGRFDLIILKDTIEHIHDQETFVPKLKPFLRAGGKVYFGFPPWRMPFGGHQQICKSRILSNLPFYHLLPRGLYRGIVEAAGETDTIIGHLMEIVDTGISINRFERVLRDSGLQIDVRTHYLINPIYEYKFGLKPKEQFGLIAAIPWFRDFVTTCSWYLASPQDAAESANP